MIHDRIEMMENISKLNPWLSLKVLFKLSTFIFLFGNFCSVLQILLFLSRDIIERIAII